MTLQKLKNLDFFKDEILLSLKELPIQGFCNINYKLNTNKTSYLVRVFKNDSSVNISRKFEYNIQKKASKIDIASKPLFIDKKKSFMITEYLSGTHKTRIDKKELKKLIKTIRKLHKIKSNKKPYNLQKDLYTYKQILKDKNSRKLIKETKKELKKVKDEKYFVTTHHDLNPRNIVFYKNTIKFIDWEYAGVNSAFFDLATVCVEFKIDKKLHNIILQTYFKKISSKNKKLLSSYIKIYSNICKLWFKSLN